MSIQKKTEIFPPEILPVRSGVYQTMPVDEHGKPNNETWGFSYFDATDRIWGCIHDTVEEAWRHPEYEFAYQLKQWRGLAEEPKS